jgi:hypothetical protein
LANDGFTVPQVRGRKQGVLLNVQRFGSNDEFLKTLENFPTGKHDDEIDGLSGAYHTLLSAGAFRFMSLDRPNKAGRINAERRKRELLGV